MHARHLVRSATPAGDDAARARAPRRAGLLHGARLPGSRIGTQIGRWEVLGWAALIAANVRRRYSGHTTSSFEACLVHVAQVCPNFASHLSKQHCARAVELLEIMQAVIVSPLEAVYEMRQDGWVVKRLGG